MRKHVQGLGISRQSVSGKPEKVTVGSNTKGSRDVAGKEVTWRPSALQRFLSRLAKLVGLSYHPEHQEKVHQSVKDSFQGVLPDDTQDKSGAKNLPKSVKKVPRVVAEELKLKLQNKLTSNPKSKPFDGDVAMGNLEHAKGKIEESKKNFDDAVALLMDGEFKAEFLKSPMFSDYLNDSELKLDEKELNELYKKFEVSTLKKRRQAKKKALEMLGLCDDSVKDKFLKCPEFELFLKQMNINSDVRVGELREVVLEFLNTDEGVSADQMLRFEVNQALPYTPMDVKEKFLKNREKKLARLRSGEKLDSVKINDIFKSWYGSGQKHQIMKEKKAMVRQFCRDHSQLEGFKAYVDAQNKAMGGALYMGKMSFNESELLVMYNSLMLAEKTAILQGIVESSATREEKAFAIRHQFDLLTSLQYEFPGGSIDQLLSGERMIESEDLGAFASPQFLKAYNEAQELASKKARM